MEEKLVTQETTHHPVNTVSTKRFSIKPSYLYRQVFVQCVREIEMFVWSLFSFDYTHGVQTQHFNYIV